MTSPSNLVEASNQLASRVLDLIEDGVVTPIILIDGRAGSGKSTLGALLQNQLFKDGESLPRLIHMDDLYDGWDGLQAGTDYLLRTILNPVVARKRASWQEFDWSKNERDRWREFEGGTPLIVEGCGSISRASAELAQVKIWVDSPEQTRRARWIEREGGDGFWPRWSAQELDFYARERSSELADFIVEN